MNEKIKRKDYELKTLKQEINLIRKDINEQMISYATTIDEEEDKNKKNLPCLRNKWKIIFVDLHLLIFFVLLVCNLVYSFTYAINHKGNFYQLFVNSNFS